MLGAMLAVAPASAQDRSPKDRDQPRAIPNYHMLTDTPRRDTREQNFVVRATVTGEGRLLWSGDLYLAEYNGARFETDLQDIDPACDYDHRRISSRNSALVLSLAPVDLIEGYEFRLKVHWSRRSQDCAAQRIDTAWINVPAQLPQGEAQTFTGDNGLVVELTRREWPG
ncbi:MAG: hypothetical protein V2J14_05060 [Erythrobacter sp.]|nr:hypothetical protein [Erythrobacter sp.]